MALKEKFIEVIYFIPKVGSDTAQSYNNVEQFNLSNPNDL